MIEQALNVARESTDFRERIGAVVVDKKGRVLSTGYNIRKTHPFQYKFAQHINEEAIYLHAETAALVKCRKKPHAIYVGRLKKDDSTGLAKPCPICMGAIVESGIKEVYYTNDDGKIEGFLVQ